MEVISSAVLAGEAVNLVRLLFLASRDKRISLGGNKMHFPILYALCNHPPPGLTMTQLAEAMLVSPQQLSRLVGGMEENGLVKREHDMINRRLVYVRALNAGRLEMERFIKEIRKWMAGELEMYSTEEMYHLHECFVFIRRLLEKGVLKYDPQNTSLKEEPLYD
ncbi:MAG: MarR family transcriptional regulator [Firmicutes bacterium]|nr:MarR family transcriptional regulator [Bacillota bacterium]